MNLASQLPLEGRREGSWSWASANVPLDIVGYHRDPLDEIEIKSAEAEPLLKEAPHGLVKISEFQLVGSIHLIISCEMDWAGRGADPYNWEIVCKMPRRKGLGSIVISQWTRTT